MRHNKRLFHCIRPAVAILPLMMILVFSVALFGQVKYRTFNQNDLSGKKAKAGKAVSSVVSFRFYNTTPGTVNSLHLKLNATVPAIVDSGGFTNFAFAKKIVDITGRTVAPGDSVTLTFASLKKAPGTQVSQWWWDSAGTMKGIKSGPITALTDNRIYLQPNGGNVLEYLYKKVITRPTGVVVGLVTDTPGVHWIRYMNADRKFFPHTGTPSRCFDFVLKKHELKNPHADKYNNHLLGQLHALKLAIIANDNGVTEPDTPATRLGDLLYNDLLHADTLNGLTLRAIVHIADSALSYCTHFEDPNFYLNLDSTITKIIGAFDGPYVAVSFTPFVVAGTQDLSSVPFLHANPNAQPVTIHRPMSSIAEPEQFALYQNYPNPFNPTTNIRFDLPQQALVTLRVYNVLGQEVATLINNEAMDEGAQEVRFDASQLASGIYLYRISAGSFVETKKMILLK